MYLETFFGMLFGTCFLLLFGFLVAQFENADRRHGEMELRFRPMVRERRTIAVARLSALNADGLKRGLSKSLLALGPGADRMT